MNIGMEFLKFIILSLSIVAISKYILVTLLRKLAETLDLKPKTVGNISGIATSVPELLTSSFAAMTGLINTSIYNILSSNIINFVQYIISVGLNKNRKGLENRAIRIDLFMVILTIFIPIAMLTFKIEANISIVPLLLLLFAFFYFINNNAHKLYLSKEEKVMGENIEKEKKWLKGKKRKTTLYTVLLLATGVLLYLVGNALSGVLENLCVIFSIPELFIGILLGFVTSIPELITFFEAQKHHNKQENSHLGLIEATNNLLSSNILNLFIIQSVAIVIFYMCTMG